MVGCNSHTGTRKTKPFHTNNVQWHYEKFQPRIKTFSGWTAEIIQHELDHCDGILICHDWLDKSPAGCRRPFVLPGVSIKDAVAVVVIVLDDLGCPS